MSTNADRSNEIRSHLRGQQIIELYRQRVPMGEIAAQLNVARGTVKRYLRWCARAARDSNPDRVGEWILRESAVDAWQEADLMRRLATVPDEDAAGAAKLHDSLTRYRDSSYRRMDRVGWLPRAEPHQPTDDVMSVLVRFGREHVEQMVVGLARWREQGVLTDGAIDVDGEEAEDE
jgi:hypothetical protein